MNTNNESTAVDIEPSDIVQDNRVVIVLDKLLAALDYNEPKIEQSNIPK